MIWRIIFSVIILHGLWVVESSAKELCSFSGKINFATNEFQVDVDFDDASFIRAKGLKTSANDYSFDLDIEHVKSPFFDLSSQIQGNLAFAGPVSDDQGRIFGELSSQYSLMDYQPVKELSSRFEIKDNRIFVNSLSFGSMAWSGYIQYAAPYNVDLIVELDKLGMKSFLDFWAPHHRFDSSGIVSGEIKLSGRLAELQLRGNLQAYSGHIESLRYDNIHLTASGIYPNILVSQTLVSKTDGMSFIVNGPVDIADSVNFKKQVKALHVSPLVSASASKAEWTIKRIKGLDSGTTEFKYLLRKDKSSLATDESALLGVERKLEF